MTSPLHLDVEVAAGVHPALVFSFDGLKSFLLNNFINAENMLKGHSVSMDGYPNIFAHFKGLTDSTGAPIQPGKFVMKLDDNNGQGDIHMLIETEFNATVLIHGKNISDVFSTLVINITNFRTKISVIAPNLIIGTPEFDIICQITPSITRSIAETNSNVPESDVLRVEGGLGYLMPRKIVTSMFETISRINLSELFTAFTLNGIWELKMIRDALIVIPFDGITIKDNLGCPEKDNIPNLTITTSNRIDIGNSHSWQINPVGVVVPPISRPADNFLNGFASIYLPKPLLVQRFGSVVPGIGYSEEGDGFIGYDVSISAFFQNIQLSIDPSRNGFVIDMDFVIQGNASVNVDVPCLGRADLASVDIRIKPSKLSVYVAFSPTPNGRLILDSQIDGLTIGDVDVSISLVKVAFLIQLAGGPNTITTFILEKIFDRILANIIPAKIRDVVTKTVNSKNIQLLDLGSLEKFISANGGLNTVTYSGNSASILVGLVHKEKNFL